MFRFFETRIDPFRAHDETMPPANLLGFYWRYCRQVWPYLACLLAVGLDRLADRSIDPAFRRRARRHAARDEPRQGPARLRRDISVVMGLVILVLRVRWPAWRMTFSPSRRSRRA